MTRNPYAAYVDGRDLLACLAETPARIEALVRGWPRALDEQSYAPGKWPARVILAHLAQCEMVFSTRLRFALAVENYELTPFEQDDWMAVEAPVSALDALAAYAGMRRMNLALCRSLDAVQRAKLVRHPEHGVITVEWIVAFFAGHERNHLAQFETIAAPPATA
jgi:hypothetical protein